MFATAGMLGFGGVASGGGPVAGGHDGIIEDAGAALRRASGSWVGFGNMALAETNARGGSYTPQFLSSEAVPQFAHAGFISRTL